MRLLRARIKNFRLLKDIELEFATDSNRNLTVVRAANESGKTTLLTALQWGLFGDDALPQRGRNFRLSPIDLSASAKASANITVEIDYELPPTQTGGVRKYRLIRSVTENVMNGEWRRGNTSANLLHLTPQGAIHIDNPEVHIRPHLPRELREVFFTDGDRALSFIEGSKGEQVKRVEGAIRSLLGLGVIEDALGHTRAVSVELNRKVKDVAGNREELQEVSAFLNTYQEQLPQLEIRLQELKEEAFRLEDFEKEADRRLSEALRHGNREDLEKALQDAQRKRLLAEKEAANATRDHTNLFKSELLGKHLLAGAFAKAKAVLDRLHQQGKIPNQTIPVLEDRLNQPLCICGESLNDNDQDGRRRRAHIQRLIEESRNSDAIQEKVTALYYGARELLRPVQDRTWLDEYKDVFGRRNMANIRCKDYGEDEMAIEAKIDELPDVDIKQLQTTRGHYRTQAKEVQANAADISARIETMHREINSAATKRDKLLQHDEKGMKISAELEVVYDLYQVLEKALETMKTMELKQVSERMNTIFLEMIGADHAQRAIITRADITPDFRIVVFGRFDQELDPSQDLNGASRRALTIAFILALTRVSEVEAPNVIDTPLGMMSGYVKQAVLHHASRQSSQLILFLTHAEITGCEDILNERAGRVYTLTNPAHYPTILVNDPGVDDIRVLLCDCNHLQYCQICERRDTINFDDSQSTVEA